MRCPAPSTLLFVIARQQTLVNLPEPATSRRWFCLSSSLVGILDSNQRPQSSQDCALTTGTNTLSTQRWPAQRHFGLGRTSQKVARTNDGVNTEGVLLDSNGTEIVVHNDGFLGGSLDKQFLNRKKLRASVYYIMMRSDPVAGGYPICWGYTPEFYLGVWAPYSTIS